jgi:hypothetical protein
LKKERDEKDKKEEEDRRKRAVAEFNSAGSNSSPAKLGGAKPRTKKTSKDMRGLSLLGETEEQFRKRQNLCVLQFNIYYYYYYYYIIIILYYL